MYNDKVMEHFQNPRNTGELENPDGIGSVGNPNCGDNLCPHVTGRNEIDVVTTLRLQLEHHRRQLLCGNLLTDALLADFPVLAEHTAQVAPAEKDGARAPPAAQRILFTVVRPVAMHHGPFAGSADSSCDRLRTDRSPRGGARRR